MAGRLAGLLHQWRGWRQVYAPRGKLIDESANSIQCLLKVVNEAIVVDYLTRTAHRFWRGGPAEFDAEQASDLLGVAVLVKRIAAVVAPYIRGGLRLANLSVHGLIVCRRRRRWRRRTGFQKTVIAGSTGRLGLRLRRRRGWG